MHLRQVVVALVFGLLCVAQPNGIVGKGRTVNTAMKQQGKCHAFCNEQHGVVKGWTGPDRNSMAEAQKDADAHNKQYHDGKGDVGVLCE